MIQSMQTISVGDNFLVKVENAIMHITVVPDTFVELEMVEEVVAKQKELLSNTSILVLLDISKAAGITKEAREFTSGEQVEGLQIALALLIQSLPMRIMANFFIKFDKPPAPTKMFTSYDSAISWLESFR